MGDEDLEAIRAKRMAELQQQYGGGDETKRAEMKSKEEDMRNSILSQVLNQQARARLSTIAAAKPEKAKMVENLLMNMARSGQLPGKLGEEELIGLLERVSEQTQKKTTVKFDRRRTAFDDDDDES